MRRILLIMFLFVVGQEAIGQQVVPVSGGSVSNGSGFFSFSLGQVVSKSDFEPAVSVNSVTASVIEGVQQPYTIEQLSIEGVSALNVEISLYPNPTTQRVKVSSSDSETQLTFRLYGVSGQLMQEGTMMGEMVLDTEDYPTGCYMLFLESGNRQSNVYRIVKIR
ncbi:MAG: T9SS type A sorting domain-containing protein [Bacteroidales bacterium]|nr:T9SS type A sorting domain-containing protein [Bacteroidales bacterium]